MLKRSAFTLLFPSFGHSAVIFNSASGRLTRLSPRAHELAIAVLCRPNFGYRTPEFLRLRDELAEKGFLVDARRDELGELRAAYDRARIDHSVFALTLAPTGACNLRCVYCYEGGPDPVAWSSGDEDAVVAFAARELAPGAELSVTWYGGEPLLALPIVLRVSNRLRELTERRRGSWSCDMVTNGTLLVPAVAGSLAAIGCREFQITLDGPREINDRLRPSRDGSSAFDTIAGNLARLDLESTAVGIRINLMRDNATSIGELVQALTAQGLAGRINVSLAPIEAMSKPCRALEDRVVSPEEFADRHFEFLRLLQAAGFTPNCVPTPVSNYCGADCEQAFVVDWAGDVFRCWNDVGVADKRLGTVREPESIRTPDACHEGAGPFDDPECRRCAVLPVCMGGCPAFVSDSGPNRRGCLFVKHRLADYLNLQVLGARGPGPGARG
jgi:uncharacterized protein